MTQPIRVGVLVDGDALPRWAVALLDAIAERGDADIVLLVVNAAGAQRKPSELGDWFGVKRNWVYRAWMASERRLYTAAAQSFAAEKLPARFVSIPRLSVLPTDDAGETLAHRDLGQIAAFELDVLLQLGFGALRGGVLGIARYGVWRLRLGDGAAPSAGPPGFWEVLQRAPDTGAMLEIVVPDDRGYLLARGAFTSNDHSVLKNREGVYWPASRWILRELAAVRRLGEAGYRQRIARRQTPGTSSQGGVGREPGFPGALTQWLGAFMRGVQRKVRERLSLEQWVLMFAFGATGSGNEPEMALPQFRMICPPSDRFWADPCVIEQDGRWWVFFEELVYTEQKGVLACLEIFRDGTWSAPRRILELPCHLSYPFVFQRNGTWYMIPETAEQRSIDLYICVEFPYRWEKRRTLIPDIAAVDATLIEHGGRWWMFANVVPNPHITSQDELWLFSTDDPVEGHWQPHVDNPVVSDATSARPAGRLWYEHTPSGPRLLRPAQNSSGHYGYALKIQAVLQLDDLDYREQCTQEIKPGWQPGIIGVHTLSCAGGLTVIDALMRQSKLRQILGRSMSRQAKLP